MQNDEYQMTERDRHLAHQIGDRAGQVVVARLLDAVQDKEIANKVIETYAEEWQRIVGKAVIRFFVWVVGVVLLIAAWKTGVLNAISDIFGSQK
jgi:hypothetical protein